MSYVMIGNARLTNDIADESRLNPAYNVPYGMYGNRFVCAGSVCPRK